MVQNTWKYRERFSDWHVNAEKNIDRNTRWRMKIMRNNIPENIISKDFLHFIIYSILSDQRDWGCKDEITLWYKMSDNEKYRDDDVNKNFPTIRNSIPSVRLENNESKEKKNIKTFRKWFENKKKQRSYKRSDKFKNLEEFENKFKEIIKNHDLRDVALNEVFELAIGDLMEDLFREKMYDKDSLIQNIKVYNTDHYDDVMAHTDFVVEVEYLWHKEYGAYDFTISHDKNNLEKKWQLEWVYCRDFAYNNWIKWKIPRNLIVVNDMQIVFNYLNDYVKYVLANDWNINSWDALKIFENMKIFWSTHNIEKVKRGIKEQLLSDAA